MVSIPFLKGKKSKPVRGAKDPTLLIYFGFAGIVYGLAGTMALIMGDTVFVWLCTLPPQDQLCICPDTLLLCKKPPCFRMAFNETVKKDAKNSTLPYYEVLDEASKDKVCNEMASSATIKYPDQMVLAVHNPTAGVSSMCKKLHCRVFLNSYTPSVMCANGLEKAAGEVCPCDDMVTTPANVVKINGYCFQGGDALKDLWYARVTRLTAQCLDNNATSYCPAPAPGPLPPPVTHRRRVATTATAAADPAPSPPADGGAAERLLLSFEMEVPENDGLLSDDMLVSALDDAEAARLRDIISESTFVSLPNPSTTTDFIGEGAADCGGDDCNLVETEDTNDRPLGDANDDASQEQAMDSAFTSDWNRPATSGATSASNPTTVDLFPDESLDVAPSPSTVFDERRLTAPSPAAPSPGASSGGSSGAASANDDLPEYAVTEWSKCTCYQQCITGVKTRSVTCPEGDTCKLPKPPAAEACMCSHCALCDMSLPVMVFTYVYWAQGGLAILVAALFALISKYDADDFVDAGILLKFMGCWLKLLPLLLRVLVYVSLVFAMWIAVLAFVPLGFNADCLRNFNFFVLALILVGCWGAQLAVGMQVKRMNAVPAWLMSVASNNSKFGKYVMGPLRAIGP